MACSLVGHYAIPRVGGASKETHSQLLPRTT